MLHFMMRSMVLGLALGLLPMAARGAVPTDNPAAACYDGPEGYPAWTDLIHWDRVIDMRAYAKGADDFEKFENARDELAAQGGGVLYYPAGEYDFTKMPADGPNGRGLLLKSGVVIRGEAPAGKPNAARDGALQLGTRFVFGFQDKAGGKVPRDWNIVGLYPEGAERRSVARTTNVGICWVHLVGAAVYFGPHMDWAGPTWGEGHSWRSPYVKAAWAGRKPDGSHPGDPFMAGPLALTANNGRDPDGTPYPPQRVFGGSGRIVLGCVLQDSCVLNDFDTMGRAEHKEGFGEKGFHMARYNARVAVYGSHVLVANNCLPASAKNFCYAQTTAQSWGTGNGYEIGPARESPILFDYGRTMGIDVNKDLYALQQGALVNARGGGYYAEGVAVLDNYVFNHGHKGFNLSGAWMVVKGNRNERAHLAGGQPVYGIAEPWRLTLDGFVESSAGGGGMVSDNYSRAFDMAGRNVWIDANRYDNQGSRPGNDGEGILCQSHNGTHWHSWAVTHNVHEQGAGQPGYMGCWDGDTAGMLIAWNRTAGWVGLGAGGGVDVAVVGNEAKEGVRTPKKSGAMTQPAGTPRPPTEVTAEVYKDDRLGDAVLVAWTDGSNNEIGFRVDRRVDGGKWVAVAYRPPRIEGSASNVQAWVDFLAPAGKRLEYRVAAVGVEDGDAGAAVLTSAVVLQPAVTQPATRPGKRQTGRESGPHNWEPADAPVRKY